MLVQMRHPFKSREPDELSADKAELLDVLGVRGDEWILVRRRRKGASQDQGLVPANYTREIDESIVDTDRWNVGAIDRKGAEAKLRESTQGTPVFLVRESSHGKRSGKLVVSVYTGSACIHFQLEGDSEGRVWITAEVPFEQLDELLAYYTAHDAPGGKEPTRFGKPALPLVKFDNPPPPVRRELKAGQAPAAAAAPREAVARKPPPSPTPAKRENRASYEISRRTFEVTDGAAKVPLGSGEFGYLMDGIYWGAQVDIRQLVETPEHGSADFRAAVEARSMLSHPCLVQTFGVCLPRDGGRSVYFLDEPVRGESLNDTFPDMSEGRVVEVAAQVASALLYLEGKAICHGDIHARNIILSGGGRIKVQNVGWTRVMQSTGGRNGKLYSSKNGVLFPPKWSAPEVIQSGDVTIKADAYSFGCLLSFLLSQGKKPWAKTSATNAMEAVLRGERPFPEGGYKEPEVEDLMMRCFEAEPDDRPPFSHIWCTLDEILDVSDYEVMVARR